MKDTNYNLLDILRYTFSLFKNKLVTLLVVLLLNLILLIGLNSLIYQNIIAVFIDNFNSISNSTDLFNALINKDIAIYYILLLLVEMIFGTLSVRIVYDYSFKINSNIWTQIKETLKYCGYYLGTYLTIYIVIIIAFLITIIFNIIPILNVILFIIFIILFIAIRTFFRFAPFTAVVKQNYTEAFSDTKRYMDRHFGGSFLIFIVSAIISLGMTILLINLTGTSNFSVNDNLVPIIIFTIVTTIFSFILRLIDITYLLFGINKEKQASIK